MGGMYSWKNFKDKFKRHGRLGLKEVKGLVVTIIIFAFIFSFREWGIDKFDLELGISNLIITIVLVLISFFVREISHRAAGLYVGYKVEYESWVLGLVIGLVLAFVSNGYILFLAPGGVLIHHLAIHRLGRFRYAPDYSTRGWIALAGPVANIIFAVILKAVHIALQTPVLHKLMMINIWIALFSMLPIPPLDGSKLFFGARYIYVFSLASFLACALLLRLTTYSLLSLIGGIFFGAVILVVFFVVIDKKI